MIIYAKLQSSRVRHQYGIFGGKSQTSFTQNATRAGSEEGQLFSQATALVTHSGFKSFTSERLHHFKDLKQFLIGSYLKP